MHKRKLLKQFSEPLLHWFHSNGRKNLPWQQPRDPYRVWVSEIMLQQTQVQTVISYFNRFIQFFPTVLSLAQASEDQVLAMWSGLGYYSRARNLHKTAKIIVERYNSHFPKELSALEQLPGIGLSTAAAILSQAFNLPHAILDANVKRVLSRFFLIKGFPEQAQVKKQLWSYADLCMPHEQCADYTQAIMDLGALCCTTHKPNCMSCPLGPNCEANKQGMQKQLPEKRPVKPIPIQEQQFLVLTNKQGQIFLEKRPPSGVWGGLYCLPTVAIDSCPLTFIKSKYDLQGQTPVPVMELKHRFSHFQLNIKAIYIAVNTRGTRLGEHNGQWFTKDQFAEIGLAKPTKIILNSVKT